MANGVNPLWFVAAPWQFWTRSPVGSPHQGPVTRSFHASLIYAWTHDWTNSGVAGDEQPIENTVGDLERRDIHVTLL